MKYFIKFHENFFHENNSVKCLWNFMKRFMKFGFNREPPILHPLTLCVNQLSALPIPTAFRCPETLNFLEMGSVYYQAMVFLKKKNTTEKNTTAMNVNSRKTLAISQILSWHRQQSRMVAAHASHVHRCPHGRKMVSTWFWRHRRHVVGLLSLTGVVFCQVF
jgi:hypothetical protein